MTFGQVSRVAGNGIPGTPGISGDGGPAVSAQLLTPAALAVTADGGILIADLVAAVVRKVSAAGVITRVAGTGMPGNSGDNGPAIEAQLGNPGALAVTADGGFLVAVLNGPLVRKVSAAGVITTVAGTGVSGLPAGDNGPAIEARLGAPAALAVTADGGFLIADSVGHVVRKVSAEGVITTVAGPGKGGLGDGGPAVAALLLRPVGLAVTADGGFLIADEVGCRVRKVSAEGVITTVAGSGMHGNSGDNGQATDAQLMAPAALAVTADGGFLIADRVGRVVRQVSAEGVITSVAIELPTGAPAPLAAPAALALTADGGLLIADSTAHVVIKLAPGPGV